MATQQEYLEQDRLVTENTLVVQPWLKNFANQYNKQHPYEIGTCLYSDVTILSGPYDNYFWRNTQGKKLNEMYQTGKAEIYYVKGAGASFIIEYKFDGDRWYRRQDTLFKAPHRTPIDAYFLYDGRRFPVPMDVAIAAKRLYTAQEYRSAIYAVLREKSALGY